MDFPFFLLTKFPMRVKYYFSWFRDFRQQQIDIFSTAGKPEDENSIHFFISENQKR